MLAALLALSTVHRQASVVVPASPRELEAWLDSDPSGERLFGALAAASRGIPPGAGAIVAERVVKEVPSATLEGKLDESPALSSGAERVFASALLESSAGLAAEVESYWASCVRSRIERLVPSPDSSPSGGPTREQVAGVLDLMLLSPDELAKNAAFRGRVAAILVRAWPESADGRTATGLRGSLLYALDSIPSIDFETSERIEAAWHAVPRRSADREVPFRTDAASFTDDVSGEIRASVFSLPSRLFRAEEVERFLASVRHVAPDRRLVVLSDPPLSTELSSRLDALDVTLVETYGRRYSPWPRDPMSFLRRGDGGTLVLVRPNVQIARPEDDTMGRELIQGLPASLDTAWGRPVWARSPVPFHNGQILLDSRRVFVSVNGLEPRILEILGRARVTDEDFATGARALRYLDAARVAARELSTLYRREVRFVHAMPGDPVAARTALATALGGAGFDLDSLLTIVKTDDDAGRGDEAEEAMVADPRLGAEILRRVDSEEWEQFRDGYGLDPSLSRVGLRIDQSAPKAVALARFLDSMADSLSSQGLRVARLPLLLVPVGSLREHEGNEAGEFLVTWNNVVLEERDGSRRAEGFSGLLPSGDAAARGVFARAGYRLDLLPPLVASVVRNGGYRCASQVLRRF